jgi:hypothetical protein
VKGGESMANVIKLTSAVILKVTVGTDEDGNDVNKNLTFKKVKATALDQDVLEVGQAIGVVLSAPVNNILRQNLDEIVAG